MEVAVALSSDAFLQGRVLLGQRGPQLEEVAGYLNGDGGYAFRCLSPGPDSSLPEGGVHGWRKWQDI